MNRIQPLHLIFLLSSCCLAYTLSPTLQFICSPLNEEHPLCALGCQWPGKEQNFNLLDCSIKSITKLPTSLQFELPVTRITFRMNKIDSLLYNTFSKVDHIEVLDFSWNAISKIDNSTLARFTSLTVLFLSHNRLTEIFPGLLDGLSNLTMLDIGHNKIQRIHASAFQATPHLQELRLQYNPIFELPEDSFQYLLELKWLDLQETGLVRLPQQIFSPTQRLEWLCLSDNAFETVPGNSLSKAKMLKLLDLSGNNFTVLVDGDFKRMSRTSVLYLNKLPRLERIEKDALAGLQELKSFFCSFNPRLAYIDPDAFGSKNSTISKQKTPPLELLSLNQNALRTLKFPLDSDMWSSLPYIDLADNPWKCDCRLKWMKMLPTETQMNIVCESPPHIHGRALSSLKSSDLKCDFNWPLSLSKYLLVISCIAAFCIIIMVVWVYICWRTPAGFHIRAKKKKQFSDAKVVPKTDTVDHLKSFECYI